MVFSVMLQIVALRCTRMLYSRWGRHSCLPRPKVEAICGCAARQTGMSAPPIAYSLVKEQLIYIPNIASGRQVQIACSADATRCSRGGQYDAAFARFRPLADRVF